MSHKLFMVSLTEREPVPLLELVRELLLVHVQVLRQGHHKQLVRHWGKAQ